MTLQRSIAHGRVAPSASMIFIDDLHQRPFVSDMPQLESTFQGTPYTIDIVHRPDGWTWSCVVDGLLKGKGTNALESEASALAAAHAEAHTLIADFFSAG